MKKYVFYGHDGSANHGCEAIVRTTVQLLKQNKENIILSSAKPEEDIKYHLNDICIIYERGAKSESLKKNKDFYKAYYQLKVKKEYFPIDALYETQVLNVGKNDIALAIGGDSYCYSNDMRRRLVRQHQVFQASGLKTVLWGYSFEPDLLENPQIIEDIESFDLITARESISYDILKSVNPNTILVADSAFILEEVRLPLPDGFNNCDLVGINASPLIERRESKSGIVRKNYERLIDSILEDTDFKILLIPHVTWPTNDDRMIHQELFEKYRKSGRIFTIGDYNCEELKGFISRCRFFIGARTHSSIAAYSTGVPTLVAGYSTKSKGIAQDLFGTDKNYVINVQSLNNELELTEKWYWLQEHEKSIRDRFQKVLPEYIGRIWKGHEALMNL